MDTNHLPGRKKRAIEILIDYLVIWIYLLLLFAVFMGLYAVLFGGVPKFTHLQAQLIALFSSVVPIVLAFAVMDYRGGTIGKRKTGLTVAYQRKSFRASLLRSAVKFLPWQLGHIGTIYGIMKGFDAIAVSFNSAAMILMFMLLWMTFRRADMRHLGDILAGTRVLNAPNKENKN